MSNRYIWVDQKLWLMEAGQKLSNLQGVWQLLCRLKFNIKIAALQHLLSVIKIASFSEQAKNYMGFLLKIWIY